jgi:PIN domain nuclease of toxin-antitoxin system
VKLLLDTHIWLWSASETQKLVPRVVTALLDPGNEKWVSAISVWEIFALERKGRISFSEDCKEWVARSMREFALHEAPLTADVIFATKEIQLPHRDPADLFLAATAKVFGLTLVTADTRLLNEESLSTLANC